MDARLVSCPILRLRPSFIGSCMLLRCILRYVRHNTQGLCALGRDGMASKNLSYRPYEVVEILRYWLRSPIQEGFRVKRKLDLRTTCYLLTNLAGRDKLTKVLQYGCRFLWWYWRTHHPKSPLGPRFEKMFRTGRNARMIIHLFRTFEELEDLQHAIQDTTDVRWRRSLRIVRAVTNSIYWWYDNITVLARNGVIDADEGKAGYRSDVCWVVACLLDIVLTLDTMRKHHRHRMALLQQRGPRMCHPPADGQQQQNGQDGEQQPNGGDDIGDVDEQLRDAAEKQCVLLCELIGPCGDLVVASYGVEIPKYLFNQPFHDGMVGLGGLVSALAALYRVYPRRANVK